ncbi:hypothetical protein [Rhodopirellula sallentina]|uniref:Uncharacterized protein n=1 Tax=Rhodopirellula sallentina SM41 TaxID=1263870 RepID=M5U2X0_9BACT|nr:hypothetical protein [Rhodopirellula sallentina]EMI52191.1 hypothetical protein RSSM_06387 [Rhodopirellula sallentina SM41]
MNQHLPPADRVVHRCHKVPLEARTFGDMLLGIKTVESSRSRANERHETAKSKPDRDIRGWNDYHTIAAMHEDRIASNLLRDLLSWPGVDRIKIELESDGQKFCSDSLTRFRATWCKSWGITTSAFDEKKLIDLAKFLDDHTSNRSNANRITVIPPGVPISAVFPGANASGTEWGKAALPPHASSDAECAAKQIDAADGSSRPKDQEDTDTVQLEEELNKLRAERLRWELEKEKAAFRWQQIVDVFSQSVSPFGGLPYTQANGTSSPTPGIDGQKLQDSESAKAPPSIPQRDDTGWDWLTTAEIAERQGLTVDHIKNARDPNVCQWVSDDGLEFIDAYGNPARKPPPNGHPRYPVKSSESSKSR